MKTYNVLVKKSIVVDRYVWAESEKEAEDKACNTIHREDSIGCLELEVLSVREIDNEE